MKITMSFIFAFLFGVSSYSQSLDASISNLATDIAQKVSKKNKVKLTLADFVNNDGKVDALTDYIRKELELKLINADDLQVMDRKHLTTLLEENHLQSQGMIDETVVKSAVSFIKIEGLVLGEITYLGDQIKVKLTVTDVTTSLMYAASAISIANDAIVKSILDPEIKPCSECGGKGTVQTQTVCTNCNGKGSYPCSDCGGTGRRSGMTVGSYITCEACGGKGKFSCNVCSGTGKLISNNTCPKCNGKIQTNFGGAKTISPNRLELCTTCNGTGKIKHEGGSCGHCNGTGKLVVRFNYVDCSYCSGTGKQTTINVCSRCNGTGKL